MKTPAVVFAQKDAPTIQDIEMPPPAPGQVQVRTEVSVVSVGTEGWVMSDLFTWSPTTYPCVPGYQRIGIITALGDGVTNLEIGQRVMATTGVWEGDVVPFWGSHVGVGNTAAGEIYAIPDHVNSLDAAGAVVAQVGYNAASRLSITTGQWVLVYGDGLIGQCASQVARARGARTILVGHRDERLALAAAHSADFIINSHSQSVPEVVKEIVGRDPVVAVLDTVQNERAQAEYVPLLGGDAPGQIVYSGFTPRDTWADMGMLQRYELTTHFVAGWSRPRMERTLALMASGQMSIAPLVTHRVSYDRGDTLYSILNAKSEPFLGMAIDWEASRP